MKVDPKSALARMHIHLAEVLADLDAAEATIARQARRIAELETAAKQPEAEAES